ncbi:MAG TPA: class I SAM-dependent methyltransferase [Bacteroidales bacterium]|nr:class I SAM-dependent methyltransferase [Bacteroidales bacterium]HPT20843.1 class I SAM-dependent methyltransferase [Bacteroidales bacterium]
MNLTGSINQYILALLLVNTVGLYAQENKSNEAFSPKEGQDGKDVLWIPTPYKLVDLMLEIADVNEKDYLIDLGSGDGRIVIAAARLGARSLGIEYNHEMVEYSKQKAKEAGVSNKTDFVTADIFGYDLSRATVITMFLLPEINLKLRPQLLDLKPGTRIVSNTFSMGDWEPDAEDVTNENWDSWYTALMWIVPARIEGKWKFQKGELNIDQSFQKFYGTYTSDNMTSAITSGKVKGDAITFTIGGTEYTGRVIGKSTMWGTYRKGTSKRSWFAIHVEV